MPHPFQKAVLAMLFCAPSTLQKKWREGDNAGFGAELVRLGFSPNAIASAQTAQPKLNPNLARFNAVADQLKTDLWDGGEPHPPDDEAAEMVASARTRDGE